ncbi:MAG: hypothetical protein PHD76_08920 [Methylacidiphilales bacterium]|nr:hypothetical protein [Candidatus Methylacidiphilales bacterium]
MNAEAAIIQQSQRPVDAYYSSGQGAKCFLHKAREDKGSLKLEALKARIYTSLGTDKYLTLTLTQTLEI